MRRLMMLLWLTVVWVTLWEVVSWANVLGGIVVGAVVLYLLPPRESRGGAAFQPIAAVRLVGYFLWELIAASGLMAWEVVTPRNRIRAAVVAVQLTSAVPGVLVAVASMVSLTPGTVTLNIDEGKRTLYIHVLHLKSLETTRMSVQRLERLTLATLPGPPHDVAANSTEDLK